MSKRSLLEALKRLLESPEVEIMAGNLKKEHGVTTYERDKETGDLKNIKIVIDQRNAPVITIVIHELLHVYMAWRHQIDKLFVDALEEAMVQSLAEALENYIHDAKNGALFKSWVKCVEEKLK